MKVVIVGAGPAGLMAAEVLSTAGHEVLVFEAKPSAGRKFLMAGKGGLNITHSENFSTFCNRYDTPQWLTPMLEMFSPSDIRAWMQGLGVTSFIGSSGRVFPTEMKAAPLLRQWLNRLKQQGVQFYYRHYWQGFNGNDVKAGFDFKSPQGQLTVQADAYVLALGGGSWQALGSDGLWVKTLVQQGVDVTPLQPANGGFKVAWSPFMLKHAGQPLKRVQAWVENTGVENNSQQIQQDKQLKALPIAPQKGEAMMTSYGIEGGLVYALSRYLRQQLLAQGSATLYLDLLPDISEETLRQKLTPANSNKLTQANLWRKAGLDGCKATLIREQLPKQAWADGKQVAALCKRLPIAITAMQPIDEAISSAGGVKQNVLDAQLMLRQIPHVYCCGEMCDWDAPTGGYLLSACLAMGFYVGQGICEKGE